MSAIISPSSQTIGPLLADAKEPKDCVQDCKQMEVSIKMHFIPEVFQLQTNFASYRQVSKTDRFHFDPE